MVEVWIEKRHCVSCDHMQDVYGVEHAHTVCFKCEKCGSVTFLQKIIDSIFKNDFIIDTT